MMCNWHNTRGYYFYYYYYPGYGILNIIVFFFIILDFTLYTAPQACSFNCSLFI